MAALSGFLVLRIVSFAKIGNAYIMGKKESRFKGQSKLN